MAKKNDVSSVRRAFVQFRATATGKTSAEDRAKFRQRFEKLASSKEGRAKIQEVTGISGVRKQLAANYPAPKSGTTSSTSSTSTIKSSIPGVGVAGPRRETEGQMESRLRANPTPYKTSPQKYSVDVTPKPLSASSSKDNSSLSNTQKVVLAGGAAGVGALALRRLRLDAIDRANQVKSAAATNKAAATKSATPSAPKASSKPIDRRTSGPRSTSLSAKTSSNARSSGSRGGSARGGTARGGAGVRGGAARGGAGVRGGQYGQGGAGGGGLLKRTK